MKIKELSCFPDESLKGKEIDGWDEVGKSERWHVQSAPIHRGPAVMGRRDMAQAVAR